MTTSHAEQLAAANAAICELLAMIDKQEEELERLRALLHPGYGSPHLQVHDADLPIEQTDLIGWGRMSDYWTHE